MLEINEGCAKITTKNKLGKNKKSERNEYLIYKNNTLIAQLGDDHVADGSFSGCSPTGNT